MSLALPAGRTKRRPNYRLRSALVETACLAFAAVLVIWSLLPIYNMVLIALSEHSAVFSGEIFPWDPSFHSFYVVWTQGFWYLERFWHQFGNSFFIGLMTMFLTLLVGTLASFTIGRMRIRHGWLLTNAALLTYVIPASFLAIPFYRIMQNYGLSNNPWSVIAAMVTFATPYAIFIFQQYGKSIPLELDESARIDGASPPQVYFRIYLPLMAPALVAVGTYALLLAWNEYLYQFLLLSSKNSMTVSVALAQFMNSDEAPWNFMMATAIIYAIPPIVIYYAVPPPHGRRPDHGRCQRNNTIQRNSSLVSSRLRPSYCAISFSTYHVPRLVGVQSGFPRLATYLLTQPLSAVSIARSAWRSSACMLSTIILAGGSSVSS